MVAGSLRLGNWVNYGGVECWITSIVTEAENVYVDVVSYSEIPVEELEGVIFTNEWIRRLRLEMTVRYADDPHNFYELRESVDDDFQPIFVLSRNNENIKEIKYVHELQNIWYSLTDREVADISKQLI